MKLSEVISIICEASIEPIFICSNSEPLGCNPEFLEAINIDKKTLFDSSLESILKDHFYPEFDNIKGYRRKTPIIEMSFIRTFYKDKPMLVPLKVITWTYKDKNYYTFSTRDLKNTIHTNAINTADISEKTHGKFEALKQIANALPCMVYCTDPTGEQIFINEMYRKTLNLDINESWIGVFTDEECDNILALFTHCLKTEKKFELECQMRASPSTTKGPNDFRWYLNRAVPVYYKDTKKIDKWIGTVTDIHDMKMAQIEKQKLEISEKSALEESRVKSEFLAVMSHELRTPLFGVIGNASLLNDKDLDQDQKVLVDTINTSANLLLMLIQDILDFSKIEFGKFKIVLSYFKLSSLVRDVESITRINAIKKGLSFKIETDSLEHDLYGDFNRILQVFNNLISNAIKFTSEGSILINVTSSSIEDNVTLLNVSVEDTGSGISEESLSRLFKPYYQEKQGAKKSMSTGLGLYISKSIIQLMNGKIGLDRLENGTKAWFQIPLETRKRNNLTIDTNYQKALKSNNSSPIKKNLLACRKVLVAEDNKINQKIICRFLNKMNINYDLANDGQEALDYYNKHEKGYYSIILMDQNMPKLSGDQVAAEIIKNDEVQKIISISANCFIRNNNDHNENFIKDYISKPFTFDTFSEVINKWIS